MRLSLFALAAALTGCTATAPIRVEPVAPEPAPNVDLGPIDQPEPEIADIEPPEPPQAPRERIIRRAVFEVERVAAWELANGVTVVYGWEPGTAGYTAELDGVAPAGGASGGVVLRAAADRAAPLVRVAADAIRTRSTMGPVTLALVGPLSWEWVEAAVAEMAEAGVRSGSAAPSSAVVDAQATVEWADVPAFLVAAEIVRQRVGAVGSVGAVVRGRGQILTGVAAPPLSPPTRTEVDAAREVVSAYLRTPAGRAEALRTLWAAPGRYRPARPPAEARALARRTAAVSPAAVAAVLRRLADS